MAIGYAAFQTNLDVKGNSQITSNWDVEIINVKEGEKAGLAESAKTPTWTKTEASMETNLYQKGDSMSYIVTIENKGSFDAKLDNINLGKGTNEEAVNITFYGYTKGQTLFKGTTTDITVTISYNPNYEGGETSSEVNTDFEFSQAEGGTITPTTDHLVTYDYLTNGGTSSNSENEYLPEGSNIKLDYTAEKEGYEFVGWNTNASAREGLKDIQINEDTTLYAIFKKDLNVTYEMGEGVTSTEKEAEVCSLYNNDKTCEITLPEITVNTAKGYEIDGWYNGETNVGMPNSKYNVNNDTTLTAKAIQTDKEGPTINFDPNSQSNYTNGTDVDINLEDETGIKEGQEISYAWSTSNTESPFTEGSTALGEVNGTGVVIDIYEGMATHYDFKKQGNTWVNTNKGIPMSYSALKVKFALDKTSNFSFDFISSCDDESGLMVFLTEDGVSPDYENIIGEYTGSNNSTFTKTLDPGNYEIYITYVTTYGNTTDYDDTLKVSNITIGGIFPIRTSQIGNKEGAKSATITAPKSLSSSYTGTYYLWVKGGIEDVLGNVSEDKVSGAFKFDNSAPTVSVSTSSTTNSITVTANASSLSGITKYEFSMDGETWYPSNSNIYTFTGLDADTRYTVGVRVTNGIGKTSMTNTREYTETIPIPTFTESGTSEKKTITITYPEGCGSTYTCSYIKDDGQPVEVNSQTVNVDFTSDGTLIGIVSDGTNENSNVYEVEMLGTMRSWAGNSSSTSDFHNYFYRQQIMSAEVVDYKEVPDNAVKSWDVSEKGNGSVMAWIINDPDNSGYYKLYIGGDGGVRANPNSSEIFSGFSSLKTVDLTKLDTSKVTDMSDMFFGCNRLTELDVSNFDTSNVTDMSSMFSAGNSDGNLTELDLSNFDTSKVTDMSSMFWRQDNLQELDISNFDTSNVTDMRYMFYACGNLTNIDVTNFDTSKVTDMSSMFYGCNRLTELDVSNFDTSNVTDMSAMFCAGNSDGNLTELDLSNFDTSNVTDMSAMFRRQVNLQELDLSSFDTRKVTDMSSMFYECKRLTKLDLSNFDTSKVTDMSDMFYYCESLTKLNLSNFDTSNVTDMSAMFQSCSSLTNLDLSNFNTSQVTDMSSMFRRCSSLTNLDVSNFDTSKVTDMSDMFSNCYDLTELDLSNFDTSKVTDMSDMFSDCYDLTELDLSNFDTSNVTSMYSLFANCISLTNLNLDGWDTSNVTKMGQSYYSDNGMFYNCSSLTSLDLSSFDTRKVTDMRSMFYGASNLKVIYVGPNWTTDSATTTDMFNNCGVSEVTLKP